MEDQYLAMDGWVLVYSVTTRRSFDVVEEIFDKLQLSVVGDAIPIVLVGNKTDLDAKRVVSAEEGQALAAKLGAEYVESSAKQDVVRPPSPL